MQNILPHDVCHSEHEQVFEIKGIESPSGSNVIDGIGVANPFQLSQHHSSAPDWPWCLTYRLVWRVHNKFSPPPRDVAHCCTDVCTGAGLYWQGLWRVSLGERQLLLRSTLTGSLTFIGSVIAVLVKYLSAWDECWGKGIESPSGSNVIDGIGVANPFQ